MPASAFITIDDLLKALANYNFKREAAVAAVSRLVDSLWDYAAFHRPDPTKPWKTRTDEGMGFPDLLRDVLIVRMADDDLLSLDDAERALDIIEDAISELSQKVGGAVRFGDLGEFAFIGEFSRTLTTAEKAWLAKMEEETSYVDKEDERQSRGLLEAVKEELRRRTNRPCFEILLYP